MRLLEGLHAVQIRRLTLRLYKKEQLYAGTCNALVWIPGFEGDEMWREHTEVIYRQWKAEELTREKELA